MSKRQTGARDKMRRPEGDKGQEAGGKGQDLRELTEKVQAAQGLLESEEADGLIGEQSPEYRALIQGAQAAMGLNWAAMKGNGVRQTPQSLRLAGQSLVIVLDLVHKAYALGVRDGLGREEGDGAAPD